jgi:putative flippase GtrA
VNLTIPPRFRRWGLDRLLHDFSKFSAVLLSAYFVEVLLFNLALTLAGTDPITAKAFSYLTCAAGSFFILKTWIWRDQAPANLIREYLVYTLVTLVGLAILLSFVGVSHYVLGAISPRFTTPWADNFSGNMVGPPLVALFRIWAYRRFVFKTPAPSN